MCVYLQDFESNNELKTKVIVFLEEVMHDPELLTQERKAAANIIRYCSVLFHWMILIHSVIPVIKMTHYTVHTSELIFLFCPSGL